MTRSKDRRQHEERPKRVSDRSLEGSGKVIRIHPFERRVNPNQGERREGPDRRRQHLLRLAVGALALLKLEKVAVVLKAIPFFDPVFSLGTLGFAAWTQSVVVDSGVVLGFLLALVVHEKGHQYALWRMGHHLRWPIYVPFVGALIGMPSGLSRKGEARVAIWGPRFGTYAGFVFLGSWALFGEFLSEWWATLLISASIASVVISGVNLIPIAPLDGGRITQAISRNYRWFGFVLLVFFSGYVRQASFMVVWLLVLAEIREGDLGLTAIRRFKLGVGIVVVSLGLFVFGMRNSIVWVDIFLYVLGALVLAGFYQRAYGSLVGVRHDKRGRQALSPHERRGWFLRYWGIVALTAILGLLHIPALLHYGVRLW